MIKKYKTWLPDFPGFYESIYSFDDSDIEYTLWNDSSKVQDEVKQFILDNVFGNVNYRDYEIDVCKQFVKIWSNEIMDKYNFIKSITYEKLVSPKEYNFSTDSIDIEIELDLELLVKEFIKNREAAEKYIHDTYTSYDGFISHYENDLDEWLNTLENDSDHKIGSMLQFLSDFESLDLYYDVMENIYNSEYIDYDKLVELVNDEFNVNIKSLDELENIEHIETKEELLWRSRITGKPDMFSDEMRWYWTD